MVRLNPYAPSGNAGELSPRLHARTDFSKYSAASAILENIIPLSEGGLMRRPGTRYVAELKSSSVMGRLKGFSFSTIQSYQIEMGANVFRFYRHQAQITAANITGSITNGDFASDVSSWTDKDTGGTAASTWNSAGYMALLGDGTETAWMQQTVASVTNPSTISMKFRIIGARGDLVYLRIGTSDGGTQIVNDKGFEVGYHVYTFTATATTIYIGFRNTLAKSLGVDDVSFIDNAAMEIQTPYAAADLFQVEGMQSADVLYLFHEDYPTYKLERFGHDTWSLVEVAWQDGPWLDENETTTTLTFSAATAGLGRTCTASAVTGINDGDGFKTTDVGRLIRLTDGTVNWGWGIIVGWTSTTVVTVDIKRTVVVATAETKWRLGAWSGTTGYPSVGAFYEQRLFAANTTDQPQTLWGSQTGDFENMAPDSPNTDGTTWAGTVQDDDALDYTISADDVNAIRGLSPGEDALVILTAGGEWVPSSTGATLTPTDIAIRRQTTHGSAQVQPVRVDNVALFVQRAGRKIREFGFAFEIDGFQALDMTRLAEHITLGGVTEMAFAEEPDSQVYVVRADGQVPTMTFRREEDVVGWARQIIGGTFAGGDAVVESVSVIPGADGAGQVKDSSARDEIWVIVKRTINGTTKRYIEVFERNFEEGDDQEDAYYSDSCITLDSAITVTAATKADPVVVTAGTHGLSSGDEVRVTEVKGMTQLNRNSYIVGVVDANNVRLFDPDILGLIVGATQANPVVIATLEAHELANGDKVGIASVAGMTDLNGNVYTVANKTATTFELSGINGTGFGAWTSGGKVYNSTDGTAFDTYISDGKLNEKVTTISGLSHLEGETVKVYADGAIFPDEVVASGAITLETPASVVHVGLPYTHKIKTLKIEGGSPQGTAVGRIKRIVGVTSVLLNSLTSEIGPSEDDLTSYDFRDVEDQMDTAPPLFTGEHFVEFDDDWRKDPRIFFVSDAPAPFTLLAIAPSIDVRTEP